MLQDFERILPVKKVLHWMQYLIQRVPDTLRKIVEASGACCKRMYSFCVVECINRCSSSTLKKSYLQRKSLNGRSTLLKEYRTYCIKWWNMFLKDCIISFKGIDEVVL